MNIKEIININNIPPKKLIHISTFKTFGAVFRLRKIRPYFYDMTGITTGVWAMMMGSAIHMAEVKVAQKQQQEFRSPMDLPLNLSGNFGQLRSTHFHAGLDIRTNQQIGHKVYAVGDGYVSRVRVNIYGYGKVVYVNHPNGKTTVYAHLDRFSNVISELVETEWQKTRKYEVDIQLKPWQIPLKSGDLLGLSGNTGGSGGPHLHFEVRDTKTEDVLNPLKNGYTIADTKKPVFTELKLYSLETTGSVNGKPEQANIPIVVSGNGYASKMIEIPAAGKIGVGINAHDPIDLNSFKMGLYKVRFYVNNEIIYGYTMDKFSFDEGRRIPIHCDYGDHISGNNAIEKLWVLPGNDSRQYEYGPGSGVIQVEAGKTYVCKVIAEDANGNSARLDFTVKGVSPTVTSTIQKMAGRHFSFVAPEADSLVDQNFKLKILPDALFDDLYITGFTINGLLSGELKAWQIGNDKVFMKKDAEMTFDISSIPVRLFAKLYMQHEGKRWVPTKIIGNKIVATYPRLGRFSVFADTLMPTMSALDISSEGTITKAYNGTFRFKVNDKETGIASWEAWLNDQFLMLEYEYKDNMLFARKPPIKAGVNNIKIVLKDGVGNSLEYNNTFVL